MELSNTVELTLEDRIANRMRLANMATEIKKQLDAENDAIKAEYVRQGIDTYSIDDTHDLVLSVRSGRSSLDKTQLVSLGVSTEVIKKATKTGADYMQLDVREKK